MPSAQLEARIGQIGGAILRYTLVFFFLAFGLYKFTVEEAAGIQALTEHSPLLFWLNPALGFRGGSNLIGVVEITLGLMIASRRLAPRLSAFGSLGTAGALLVTLSFLVTTPGLGPDTSGFLMKDMTLFGAALWSAAEAFAASRARRTGSIAAGAPLSAAE